MEAAKAKTFMGFTVCDITAYNPTTHTMHLGGDGEETVLLQPNPVNNRPVVASHVHQLAGVLVATGAPYALEHVIDVLVDPDCLDPTSIGRTVEDAVQKQVQWVSDGGNIFLMNGRHRITSAFEARKELETRISKGRKRLENGHLMGDERIQAEELISSDQAQQTKLQSWLLRLWNKGMPTQTHVCVVCKLTLISWYRGPRQSFSSDSEPHFALNCAQ